MDLALSEANIVLIAEHFNPSILTPDWIISNVLKQEPKPPKDFISTPVLSVFDGVRFKMTVDVNRAQLSLKEEVLALTQQLFDAMQAFVETLPQTPYKAVGINFMWSKTMPDAATAQAVIRKIIGCSDRAVADVLGHSDYGLEAILTTMYKGSRLRIRLDAVDEHNNCSLRLNFNYHADVSSTTECLAMMRRGRELQQHSQELSLRFTGGSQ